MMPDDNEGPIWNPKFAALSDVKCSIAGQPKIVISPERKDEFFGSDLKPIGLYPGILKNQNDHPFSGRKVS
jgi:hypothetical protein